jgi:MFS family permease
MTGDFVSQTGSWLQRVAVGWLTWELTGSATWLGVIAFMDLAPALVVSPIAGAYADRMDRLRFIKLTINLTLLQPVALAVLFYSGAMNIWWLFALSLYHGVINAASLPARLAIVPSLVPRTDLSSAIALNSVIFNLSRFTGPAAAGVIITTAGVGMAFVVNALTFFAFALTLAMLSIATEPAGEAKKHILADVAQGFRYMVSHPGIGPLMMLLITSAILARPFIDLLPGFAADVFGRGAEALAWMVSVTGLGAGCGALWLAMRDSIKGLTVIAVSFVRHLLGGATGLVRHRLRHRGFGHRRIDPGAVRRRAQYARACRQPLRHRLQGRTRLRRPGDGLDRLGSGVAPAGGRRRGAVYSCLGLGHPAIGVYRPFARTVARWRPARGGQAG